MSTSPILLPYPYSPIPTSLSLPTEVALRVAHLVYLPTLSVALRTLLNLLILIALLVFLALFSLALFFALSASFSFFFSAFFFSAFSVSASSFLSSSAFLVLIFALFALIQSALRASFSPLVPISCSIFHLLSSISTSSVGDRDRGKGADLVETGRSGKEGS